MAFTDHCFTTKDLPNDYLAWSRSGGDSYLVIWTVTLFTG